MYTIVCNPVNIFGILYMPTEPTKYTTNASPARQKHITNTSSTNRQHITNSSPTCRQIINQPCQDHPNLIPNRCSMTRRHAKAAFSVSKEGASQRDLICKKNSTQRLSRASRQVMLYIQWYTDEGCTGNGVHTMLYTKGRKLYRQSCAEQHFARTYCRGEP